MDYNFELNLKQQTTTTTKLQAYEATPAKPYRLVVQPIMFKEMNCNGVARNRKSYSLTRQKASVLLPQIREQMSGPEIS